MMGAHHYSNNAVMSQQEINNNSSNDNDTLNANNSPEKQEEATGKASPTNTNLTSQSPRQSSSSSNSSSKFPHELYRMLETVSSLGLDHIVSWNPDGNSLVIHNKHLFESQVMLIFFQRLKYSSFKRLLHLHGFKSVSQRGQDKGTFYHASFVRNKQELLDRIQKGEKKKPSSAGKSSATSLKAGRPPKSKSAAKARKTAANTKDDSSSAHSKTSSCDSPRPGSRKASPSSTPNPILGMMATFGQLKQESSNANATEVHASIEAEPSSPYDRSFSTSSGNIIHRQNQNRGTQEEQMEQQRQMDQTSLNQVVYGQPSVAMNPHATNNNDVSLQVSRTNTNSTDGDMFSMSLDGNQNSGQMLLSIAQQQEQRQRQLQQQQQQPWTSLFSDNHNQLQQRLLEQQLQEQLQSQQEQILLTQELVRRQQQQTQGQGLHQSMMDFLRNSAGNTESITPDASAGATTRRAQQLGEASNPLWDVLEPRPFAPNAAPSVSTSRPIFAGVPISQNITGMILPSASTSTNIASTSLFNALSNINTASISSNINNEDSKDNTSSNTSNNNSIVGDERSLHQELFNAWFSSSGGNGGEGPPGANRP